MVYQVGEMVMFVYRLRAKNLLDKYVVAQSFAEALKLAPSEYGITELTSIKLICQVDAMQKQMKFPEPIIMPLSDIITGTSGMDCEGNITTS